MIRRKRDKEENPARFGNDMMPRTALVTGCAGFIASHLVDRLLDEGYRVIGVDNFRTGTKANIAKASENPNFRFLEEDITSYSFGDTISEELDIVFHLAAVASVSLSTKDPLLVNKHNVEGTLNVLEIARKRNAKRFVFSSSAAVYGNPELLPVREDFPLSALSPYAASKISAEYYVQSYRESFGIDYVILRFFNVYGPRQDESEYSGVIAIFAGRAMEGKPLMIEGDGHQTRSFIHIQDVVDAIFEAGEKDSAKNQILNISGNEVISILELAQTISKLTDVEIIHRAPRIGDIRDSVGETTKARSILGVGVTVPLKEGLQETLDWYRARI